MLGSATACLAPTMRMAQALQPFITILSIAAVADYVLCFCNSKSMACASLFLHIFEL
jgi:hypothetical protein